ncbi:MAG TPA: hypothetical protein VGH89_27705 [Pseudonocardia sp.]
MDHQLLARLLGAMLDGCGLCAELLLVMLAEDALTTARLVELCCMSAREQGGINGRSAHPNTSATPSAWFRELAEAGVARGSAVLSRRCQQMTPDQRREVASDDMTVLIHQLSPG